MTSGKLYKRKHRKATTFDARAYLNRIHEKWEKPSLKYLKRLHRSHMIYVPFENLDIHYGQKISLDYQKNFKKIVKNKRGGLCYELNGLFYHLLCHLDFKCYLISAKVKNSKSGQFGKDYGHMAIIVIIDKDPWLVDVGFGEGIVYPKKIEKKLIQVDYTNYWRIEADQDANLLLQVSHDAKNFETKFSFIPKQKQAIQFMEMCDHHQTSPDSIFMKKKLITCLTTEGRITLTDRRLKTLILGKTEESSIMNEDQFLSKLEQYFGISFQQLFPCSQG